MNSCSKVINEEFGIEIGSEKQCNLQILLDKIDKKKASILIKCDEKTKNDFIDSMLESDKDKDSNNNIS